LTTDVETRLAVLKSSTHINGIQRQLFLVPVSEAKASGMVSNQNERLSIPESRQESRLPGYPIDATDRYGWCFGLFAPPTSI
jgi:hypothetical protein